MQAPNTLRNRERMEESVPDVDYDQLQHFLTKSPWDHQAAMDQVGAHADACFAGHQNTCLLIDESCFVKKGRESAGVARQWCGRLGKIENCQVGVFAALGKDTHAVPIDARLYLPEEWTADSNRCTQAKVPASQQAFHTKSALAYDMIQRARQNGLTFHWIAADAAYGSDTSFLRQIDELGETFVMDVRSNQCVFLTDPKPAVPPAPENGRPTTIKRSDASSVRVDEHVASMADNKWRKVRIRHGTKGAIWSEAVKIPVWIWPQKGPGRHACSHWVLIVTRDPVTKSDIKYSLTNAAHKTSLRRLAFMQKQRFWVEHGFKEAKSTCGLADYQVRTWVGWHHHVALVMMVHMYMIQEKMTAPPGMDLLSANDVRDLLVTFLPKPDASEQDILQRIEKRHRKRRKEMEQQQI